MATEQRAIQDHLFAFDREKLLILARPKRINDRRPRTTPGKNHENFLDNGSLQSNGQH